ncbi:MAG: type II and III secretion system protein [Armatimonadetes bacterium CSP1-3]|nr:MAG: type II and III secretion system protein [Armatimonadetes bacterium CSP1-3]
MWRTGPRSRRFSIPLTLILALATVISMWPAAAVATPAVRVTSIGVKTYPGVVQVAISGSGPLRFRATTMSNPFRVLIDIPGALLAGTVPAVLNVAQPPVLRVRAGQFQQSTVRVVIDLAAPTAYQVSAVTPSVLAARLTVPQTAAKVTKPAVAVAAAPPPAAPAVARAGTPVAQAPPAPATAGRITIDLRNAELSDVLSALAKLCGFNIVTDSSVKGQITVRLADVTCEEALRFILDANNLGFRRIGNNLIVMAADKLAPPPEVPEPVIYPLGYADPDKARAAIAASVPGVRVAIDQRTNMLIVFGTAAQHEQVQKILAALDIQIPQIMIETRVVDINTEVLKDLGLTWGSVDGLVGFPITITSITAPGPIPATLTVMTSSAAFQFFLTALVKNDKARVLSAPRVAVIDGNKATINLGQEVPIPQRDANGNVTFTFKPVGVILEITPRLNRDGNITTMINSEVSSIRGFTTTEVPFLNTRKANTTVTVKNGESIIIGGMISAEERETTIKVPLLGDIPIIGVLFRRTKTDRTEAEVIFVVTPTLLSTGK